MDQQQLEQVLEKINEVNSLTAGSGPFDDLHIALAMLAVTTIGLIAAIWQLYQIKQQIKLAAKVYEDDHERSRKLLALETISNFTRSMKPEFRGLSLTIDNLDKENTALLREAKEFRIPHSQQNRVANIIDAIDAHKTSGLSQEGSYVKVSAECSMLLRSVIHQYMNLIELAIAPAYTGICDPDIIKEQLRPFFIRKKADGKEEIILKEMREHYRRSDLPNTFRFADEIAISLIQPQEHVQFLGAKANHADGHGRLGG